MDGQNSVQEAWLCLRFTHLSLNSAGFFSTGCVATDCVATDCVVTRPTAHFAPDQTAVAIVEKQQLFQCNDIAQQSGLQAGMSVSQALMLNPTLVMQKRNQAQEARKIQEISHWAYRFTSHVSVHKEDTLLLEIGKSIKLFNGLNNLVNLIRNGLGGIGADAVSAVGHTPKAAYVLSFIKTTDPKQAMQTPVNALLTSHIEHLDIDHRVLRQLQHCGFETLEDLAPISAAELGRRFGVDFLRYMDQLWGRIPDPQLTISPPETFAASADFAEPVSNLNWIYQQLDRLLQDLVHFTTGRQLVCRSFTWRFYHENNRLLQTVTIGLTAQQNDFATFRELTDLKLSALTLDWEFASIELISSQLVPRCLFNDDLFDPQPSQEQFNQLIDKLTNRLGHQALFKVYAAPEHLPELANQRQLAAQEGRIDHTLNSVDLDTEGPALKDQPLWLLENPQRLSQVCAGNKPQPIFNGPLTIIHGPDRITSHWWNKAQNRDYFIARQRSGRLLWLFFDRNTTTWYLHGLFA